MKKYLLPLCYVATLATVPGSTFTCLNACFSPLLAPGSVFMCLNGGGKGWELEWEAHAMSLLLAAEWFKLQPLGLQERSCLSPSAPLSSGLFFGYHFRYPLDDDL